MVISFFLLSVILYFTNRGIKKGLKPFFEQEKQEVPKLPNKSITLILAAIVSVMISNDLVEKVLLFVSNVSFNEIDIIFGLDVSYYMFIKPLIETVISYLIKLIIGLSLYMTLYYLVVFNLYFTFFRMVYVINDRNTIFIIIPNSPEFNKAQRILVHIISYHIF